MPFLFFWGGGGGGGGGGKRGVSSRGVGLRCWPKKWKEKIRSDTTTKSQETKNKTKKICILVFKTIIANWQQLFSFLFKSRFVPLLTTKVTAPKEKKRRHLTFVTAKEKCLGCWCLKKGSFRSRSHFNVTTCYLSANIFRRNLFSHPATTSSRY